MAIAYVQEVNTTNAASGSVLTSSAITVTGGNLLVACWYHLHDNVAGTGTPTVTITDSQGNTWNTVGAASLGVASVADGTRAGIAYCMNAAAGSTTFTMTFSGSGVNRTNRGLGISEWSGCATSSALDHSYISANRAVAPNTSPTFTPSVANVLAIRQNTATSGTQSATSYIGGILPTVMTTGRYVLFTTQQTNITSVAGSTSGGAAVIQVLAVFKAASTALTSGTASSSSVGSTTATLDVTVATGGTSPYTYQWYRDTTPGFTPSGANDIVGATSTTLNDTGLTPSTTYYYRAIATDNVAATVTSNEVTVSTNSGSTSVRSRVVFVS